MCRSRNKGILGNTSRYIIKGILRNISDQEINKIRKYKYIKK